MVSSESEPFETGSAPVAPESAAAVFGAGLQRAQRYADLLADTGVAHGLIGPREVPRLWSRHLLNCAVISPGIAEGLLVVDVGSGAGLPGIPVAIARPDLTLHLVEPLLRRTTWLAATVADLELANVVVHRGRAQDMTAMSAPVVVARAVAKLAKLAGWCLPLLGPTGSLMAMKGAGAARELSDELTVLRRMGVSSAEVETYGAGVVEPPATVVRLVKG